MRQKEVSTRRIRPTLPEINVPLLMETLKQWRNEFEEDGCVTVFDDGLLQFQLCGQQSHHIFYAALVLHKPSLRCSLSEDAPEDILEEHHNRLHISGYRATDDEKAVVDELNSALAKRVKIVLSPDNVQAKDLFKETILGENVYNVDYPFQPFDPNWWLPHYFAALTIIVLLIIVTFVLSTDWFRAFLLRKTGSDYTLRVAAKMLSEDRPTGHYNYKTKLNDYYHWEKLMDSYVELKKMGQWFTSNTA